MFQNSRIIDQTYLSLLFFMFLQYIWIIYEQQLRIVVAKLQKHQQVSSLQCCLFKLFYSFLYISIAFLWRHAWQRLYAIKFPNLRKKMKKVGRWCVSFLFTVLKAEILCVKSCSCWQKLRSFAISCRNLDNCFCPGERNFLWKEHENSWFFWLDWQLYLGFLGKSNSILIFFTFIS